MNPFKRFKLWQNDRKATAAQLQSFVDKAKAFVDENPDALVIIGDTKTDAIFMAYRGIAAPVRILNKDGSRNFIVANALRHEKKQVDIDRFLLAVDGGLFTIAKGLYDKRRSSLAGKVVDFVKGTPPPPVASAVSLTDSSVLSPVQVQDIK